MDGWIIFLFFFPFFSPYLGAQHVTTLEYGKIKSEHPQISTMIPEDMRKEWKKYMESFDAVLTFSSVEHSGLGRYGDGMYVVAVVGVLVVLLQ